MVSVTFSDVTLGHQLQLIALGLATVWIGAWRLFDLLLPEKRHYLLLRAEVDHFLDLVRQLNTTACVVRELPTPENRQIAEEVKHAMHKAVEQMVVVAGIPYSVASPMPRRERQQPYAEALKATSMNAI
jgi:hypothetical protein